MIGWVLGMPSGTSAVARSGVAESAAAIKHEWPGTLTLHQSLSIDNSSLWGRWGRVTNARDDNPYRFRTRWGAVLTLGTNRAQKG